MYHDQCINIMIIKTLWKRIISLCYHINFFRLSGEKTNIWLCLYPDCYMRGCTNIREGETEDHSTQHNLEYPGHCLQLNMSSWRAWCYKCQAEVFLTKNKPVVRGAFGKKRSSSGTASSNIDKYLGVSHFIHLN